MPLTQAILVSTRRLGTSSALTVNPISVARRIAPDALWRAAHDHSGCEWGYRGVSMTGSQTHPGRAPFLLFVYRCWNATARIVSQC